MPYYDKFIDYQSFESVDELNAAVRAHLRDHAGELTETAVNVLMTISRYSCVVPGVSWLKVATLAGIVGKSEKTVRRALKALESVGIIHRVPTIRERGGRGHDITIIQPAMSARDQSEIPRDDANNKPKSFKETTDISSNIYVSEPTLDSLDHTYTPSHIPADFTRAAKPFFGAYRIYRLWGTVRVAYRQSGIERPLEQLIGVIVQAFRESIFALKARCIRGDFGGYFYGTLRGMFAVERRREVAQSGRLVAFDWLAR